MEWKESGVEYQADPKHAKLIIKAMALNFGSRSVESLIEREMFDEEAEKELNKEDASKFRQVAARLNYLAVDRPDLQFPTKEICRGMAKPQQKHLGMLKRIARYLVGRPVVKLHFESCEEKEFQTIVGYSDSDWAGASRL